MGCPTLLTPEERITIETLEEPEEMESATDTFQITQTAWVHLKDMDIKVKMYLYPGCPFLLSMGNLCTSDIDFFWPRGEDPIMTIYDDNGKQTRTITLSMQL